MPIRKVKVSPAIEGKVDTIGRKLNNHYQRQGGSSAKRRIIHVVTWALMVATISAVVAAAMYLSGGVALPVGISLAKHVSIQAGVGLIEGLLYGTMSEIMGAKQAKASINEVYGHLEKEVVRDLSANEIEEELVAKSKARNV